ncbi:XylR family transcriptional regulator [Planctomicrobium sp. SH661]|uniref:XylR family transcriptional regulator n=1 Tax=Planctomicrobium sp. SH661 TaxID=3448124 RepID=UPI003F5BC25F
MRKYRKVALLVDTSRETGRGILRGIIRYNQEHGPWSTYFQPQGLEDPPPKWLLGWKGDGIIARINSQRTARVLSKTGLPVIDVRAATVMPQFPRIEVDNEIMVDMVVSYLLDRGLRQFGFCGYPKGLHRLYDERCDSFIRRVEKTGLPCVVFRPESSTASTLSWDAEQRQIERWVRSLKGQIGIMACNDDLGRILLDACRRANRSVPDEIAVIGVENDPFLCTLSQPPLTSVDVNSERMGFNACVLLENLMQGKTAAPCTRHPPLSIVHRQSTDILAIDDPDLVAAIRHIQSHACMGMSVTDITDRIPVSRSTLNRKFQDALGRSPKDEITRVQMERARELLVNTDMSIHSIASSCGFTDSNYFSKWFHDQEGASPRQFRLNIGK